ncbi:MAG TPA: galactokinase family protein [Vicinamibacterales bacterium]|nr:galactokinase family protein [Vicinamibacterales bacterium]
MSERAPLSERPSRSAGSRPADQKTAPAGEKFRDAARPDGRPAEGAAAPTVFTAEARGRVNLIGEHTDYNGGRVLPVATPLSTRVRVELRGDTLVRAWSANVSGAGVDSYRLGEERRTDSWIDYVQGVTSVLAAEGCRLTGFDLRVDSDLPPGGGLGSSAALVVALLRALAQASGMVLGAVDMARLAQRAEHTLAGAPVGLMDPLASALADERTAILIDLADPATPRLERVPLPAGMDLIVVDSGLRHAHAHGGYRIRRAECERAAALLGVDLLGHLPADEGTLARLAALPAPLDRRAGHVVLENARVLAAAGALRAGDLETFGRLLDASHASLREAFEVSTPELDRLVAIARRDPDVFGARLTGGGFGGCVVAAARAGRAAEAAGRIVGAYNLDALVPARTLLPR